jgi:hypothetical protein
MSLRAKVLNILCLSRDMSLSNSKSKKKSMDLNMIARSDIVKAVFL